MGASATKDLFIEIALRYDDVLLRLMLVNKLAADVVLEYRVDELNFSKTISEPPMHLIPYAKRLRISSLSYLTRANPIHLYLDKINWSNTCMPVMTRLTHLVSPFVTEYMLRSLPVLSDLTITDNCDHSDFSVCSRLTKLTTIGNAHVGDTLVCLNIIKGHASCGTSLRSLTLQSATADIVAPLDALHCCFVVIPDSYIPYISSLTEFVAASSTIADGFLCNARQLRKLTIRSCDIQLNDSVIEKLTSLTYLCLDRTPVTGCCLGSLTSLQKLDINLFEDECLVALSSLTSLTDLRLGAESIVDEDITTLTNLTALKIRPVYGTSSITDRGIAQLKNLTSLSVRDNKCITDFGVSHLALLTRISIRNSKLSNDCVNRIRNYRYVYTGSHGADILVK